MYTGFPGTSKFVREDAFMDTSNRLQKTVAEQLDAARLLRMKQVEHYTGLKKSALYNRIKAGSFPKPCYLSGSGRRGSRWRADHVAAWVTKQSQGDAA